MTSNSEDENLGRDMIDVHGNEAATVARQNARAAALAGQAEKAKSWIRVLGTIQRQTGRQGIGNSAAIYTITINSMSEFGTKEDEYCAVSL